MNEFMIFIWVIGWLFAVGDLIATPTENKHSLFGIIVGIIFLAVVLIFLWPVWLGAAWAKK